MKLLVLFLLACAAVPAQEVVVSQKPESNAYTTIFHYTAGLIDYICTARSNQTVNPSDASANLITVSTISNANLGSNRRMDRHQRHACRDSD
jgi:hypothetical protein